MEVVTAIGSKLGEYLVEAALNQVRYLCRFNNIVEDLEDKENNLKSAKDRIKNEVEREEKNTKEIEKDVEKWLKDVDNAMADVQRLKEEIQAKKNCLSGWCLNWGWQYRLSRKAAKTTSLMLKLQKNGKFSTLAHPKPLPGIEFSAPSDFTFFEATKRASDLVIEALKDEKAKMVGLYGSGGAGKTTLVKVVGQTLHQQKIFDEVVIAVVSQHPNIINVQNQLAESLGLKLQEVNKEERAKRLYLRFTDTKSKTLIVLDDVWEKHDLKKELGIPVDGGHNNCKILLTTRRQQVCDLMGCDCRVPLGILKPEEGLALLKKHAGLDDDDSTLIDVAKEIAGKCKGLPLAIAAVGSALIGKDVHEWKVVSRKLKKGELDYVDDINVDVYSCLKLSYDYLKCEDSKLCFLLCSLFPEDYEIDLENLIRYGMGLGCYHGVESIEEARNLLRGTIKGLKASSLLLDTGIEGFVKMHDIVRDVALRIGLNEMKFFSKAGNGLTEWPEDEGMKQYTGVSLMENSIDVLPNGLVLPNLNILLLGNDDKSFKFDVPDKFFEGMKALKVVTIKGGKLSLKSLEFLTNLRVLQLINCQVRDDIAFLEKLKTLQILGLRVRDTDYQDILIPRDLGDKLNKLKLLDLGFASWIKIHPAVLRRFSRLQEFYGRIVDWEVEGTRSENRFSELDSKPSFPELSRYNIKGNGCFYAQKSHTNSLGMERIEAASLVILSALYQNLQCLSLDAVSGCENIVPSIDQRGLNELTCLTLSNCEDLECIMNASQPQKSWNRVMLLRLATLHLISLPKLQWIWKAPAQHVSLQNLTEVEVTRCHKLSYLFTLSQTQSLKQLELLVVEDCERLECIVGAKSDDNKSEMNVIEGVGENIALPMLMRLELGELPNLVSFCPENYHSTWQAIRELRLRHCPRLNISAELHYVENLQTLSVEKCPHVYGAISAQMKHGFKSLEELELSGLPELEVLYKGTTQNLTTLNVFECNGLRHLLSPILAQNLLQLKELCISNCSELEQIIDDSEDLDQDHLKPIFFPKLISLEVEKCSKLKRLFHINVAPSLEKLKSLIICDNDELVKVFWQKDEADVVNVKEFVMTRLQWLRLYGLPKLTNFCPKGYHFTCPSLSHIHCKNEAQQTTWTEDCAAPFPWKPYLGLQILSVKNNNLNF